MDGKDARIAELERLYDDQKRITDKLATERDDYKRQLKQARRELKAQAYLAKAGRGLVDSIYEQSQEVVDREDDIERLTKAIRNFHSQATTYHETSMRGLKKWLDLLNKVEKKMPHSVALVITALQELHEASVGVSQGTPQRVKELRPDISDLNDIYNHPEITLADALSIIQRAAAIEYSAWLSIKAAGLAHVPEFVAEQLLRECRVHGEPDVKTLQKLDPDWLAANLPEAPAKHQTLFDGLVMVWRQISSGDTPQQFYIKTGEPERTLRKYRGWWDTLEAVANRAVTIEEKLLE